jgi:hypothetical protein
LVSTTFSSVLHQHHTVDFLLDSRAGLLICVWDNNDFIWLKWITK